MPLKGRPFICGNLFLEIHIHFPEKLDASVMLLLDEVLPCGVNSAEIRDASRLHKSLITLLSKSGSCVVVRSMPCVPLRMPTLLRRVCKQSKLQTEPDDQGELWAIFGCQQNLRRRGQRRSSNREKLEGDQTDVAETKLSVSL